MTKECTWFGGPLDGAVVAVMEGARSAGYASNEGDLVITYRVPIDDHGRLVWAERIALTVKRLGHPRDE